MNYDCGRVDVEELLACSLNLKKSEFRIFKLLFKEENALTAIELSDKLTLDRTTVQKILKKFLDQSLVQRFQENLDNGGYLFRYKVRDKLEIKKHIKQILTNWYSKGNELLEKL